MKPEITTTTTPVTQPQPLHNLPAEHPPPGSAYLIIPNSSYALDEAPYFTQTYSEAQYVAEEMEQDARQLLGCPTHNTHGKVIAPKC